MFEHEHRTKSVGAKSQECIVVVDLCWGFFGVQDSVYEKGEVKVMRLLGEEVGTLCGSVHDAGFI